MRDPSFCLGRLRARLLLAADVDCGEIDRPQDPRLPQIVQSEATVELLARLRSALCSSAAILFRPNSSPQVFWIPHSSPVPTNRLYFL